MHADLPLEIVGKSIPKFRGSQHSEATLASLSMPDAESFMDKGSPDLPKISKVFCLPTLLGWLDAWYSS